MIDVTELTQNIRWWAGMLRDLFVAGIVIGAGWAIGTQAVELAARIIRWGLS